MLQHALLRRSDAHDETLELVQRGRVGRVARYAFRFTIDRPAETSVKLRLGKYASPVFAVKIGEKAIRKSIREQLGVFKEDALERMGKFPTVIGEIGIPMELDDKYAYGGRTGTGKGKGDYREQVGRICPNVSRRVLILASSSLFLTG